jgi:hypothetical protein
MTMKTLIKALLITSLTFPTLLTAQKNPKRDSTITIECLKVKGLALDERSFAIDGAEIRLFRQNDLMEQIEVTNVEHHDHNFTFTLETNGYYTIKVSKPGYVERWIVVRTNLPGTLEVPTLFNFEFVVVLFKEKQMDDYYLDFPIAFVSYNQQKHVFESNVKYTKYIKSMIKEAEEAVKKNKALLKTSVTAR